MRSTKDLKGMVNDARGRSKQRSMAQSHTPIHEDVTGENRVSAPYDTAPGGDKSAEYNFVRKGAAAYATQATDDDTLKKLRKLEVLAADDKETIESQQKKMNVLRAELDHLTTKYGQLKRNYDSVSLHAKKDSAMNQKILEMKETYEKQIDELQTAKLDAETELREIRVHFSSSEAKCKEQALKITQQTKEIESLKKEMERNKKMFENQLSTA